MVTESQSSVKVFVRTRPTQNFAYDNIVLNQDGKYYVSVDVLEQSIDVHGRISDKAGYVNNQISDWSFKLDGVFHDVGQDYIYEVTAKDCVFKAFQGFNATIMCYGQTGAGKTFTMTGATEAFSNRGIIPRAIQQVFREINELPDCAINVKCSYLEIYNEILFDLLSMTSHQTPMTIVEDETGTRVHGLSQHIANNEEEALNLLFEGETNRAIADHQMNKHSSRSHTIFTILIESRQRSESSTKFTVSKLNFVDLAGSERLGKTSSSGRTQAEAMHINKSLTFLEQAIIAITDKRREHVPYRQSKLTHALKDSIGGNCNTIMIANVWSEKAQLEETISTLRFATRMMCVPVHAIVNEVADAAGQVRQLEKEVRALRQELSLHDTLIGRTGNSYEALGDSQLTEIQRQVRLYLAGQIDSLDIVNVRQVQAVFTSFRSIVRTMQEDMEARIREKFAQQEKPGAVNAQGDSRKDLDMKYVGEPDNQGFGVGIAPAGSKPAKSVLIDQKKAARKSKGKMSRRSLNSTPVISREASPTETPSKDTDHPPATASSGGADRPSTPPPRHVAFEEFKKEDGFPVNKILADNKEVLMAKKNEANELAKHINSLKASIDETKEKIAEAKANDVQGEFIGESNEEILDQEQYYLVKKMQDLKLSYRTSYQNLQAVKSEISYCQKLVDQCRQRLISDFDLWYFQSYMLATSEFQPAIDTAYGPMLGVTAYPNYDEDAADKFDRDRSRIMMQDSESFHYHNAKRAAVRRYNAEKTEAQLRHDEMIVPPRKPQQMVLNTEY